MYNAIIVDDEPVIRFGLKASVNWDKEGLHLLGDFANGEEALKGLKGHTVDLLITDIKMPVMDGICLMKEMQKLFPGIKVILVSSYTDFQYVREGLRLGAVDYVLKATLEPDEFSRLIQTCVAMIRRERLVEEKLQLATQTVTFRERKSLEQTIKRVILDGADYRELQDKFGWLQGNLLMITMSLNNIKKLEEQFGFLHKTMLLEDIQNYFYKQIDEGICFSINENQMLLLLKTSIDPNIAVKKLKAEIEEVTSSSYTFGFDVIRNLSQVIEGYRNSSFACERRFFYPNQTIFRYQPLETGNLPPLNIDLLHQILLPYDKQRITAFLGERFAEWESGTVSPSEIKKDACELLSHLFHKKAQVEDLLGKCNVIKKTETLEELTKTMTFQIEEYTESEQQTQYRHQGDNAIMKKALDFIHGHYTEELTLQLVSSHVHISRNYFSVLFKRSVGKNFIDYVMELRIKKACELLENTSLKVYEVAEQSGFKDVKYFSKLFKKLMGASPVDFRSKNQSLI
ncbi:response regulator [Mesobacillus foraminis]|uniref:response regulator transcription factor n=1 Tax=Mesobacillus foraminis TaxID=279826 RepID=UPI0039A1A209